MEQLTKQQIRDNPIDAIKVLLKSLKEKIKNNISNSGLSFFKGRNKTVKLPNGKRIDTTYILTDISKVIASHGENGTINKDFPQELQPRDREREASQAWVQKTAKDLDPDSLGSSSRVDTGAPIIGQDFVVESGNGRTMAIMLAYKLDTASDYKQWLQDEASYFGFSIEQVESLKNPILLRMRTTPVDRKEFVIQANQDDKLTMTATERAKTDATRIDDNLIQLFTPSENGDLLAVSNKAFLDGFMSKLGDTESAQYRDKNGNYTQAFATRIKQAVFAKAYNDDRLLEMMADQTNTDVQNMINALTISAPKFVEAQALDKGKTETLTNDLVNGIEQSLNTQLVHTIIDATNAIMQAKRSNQSITEYVKQQGLFGDIPESVLKIAIFIVENNRSAKKMSIFFSEIAKYVEETLIDSNNFGLFGEPEPISVDDAVKVALERYAKKIEQMNNPLGI